MVLSLNVWCLFTQQTCDRFKGDSPAGGGRVHWWMNTHDCQFPGNEWSQCLWKLATEAVDILPNCRRCCLRDHILAKEVPEERSDDSCHWGHKCGSLWKHQWCGLATKFWAMMVWNTWIVLALSAMLEGKVMAHHGVSEWWISQDFDCDFWNLQHKNMLCIASNRQSCCAWIECPIVVFQHDQAKEFVSGSQLLWMTHDRWTFAGGGSELQHSCLEEIFSFEWQEFNIRRSLQSLDRWLIVILIECNAIRKRGIVGEQTIPSTTTTPRFFQNHFFGHFLVGNVVINSFSQTLVWNHFLGQGRHTRPAKTELGAQCGGTCDSQCVWSPLFPLLQPELNSAPMSGKQPVTG